MRTTKEVDAAIKDVRAKIEQWQLEKAQCADTLKSLDSIIEKHAFDGMSGDSTAAKKLDKASAEAVALEATIKKLNAAIAGAQPEIEKLETEHAEAERAEWFVEFQGLAEKGKDEACLLSSSFMGFADIAVEHGGTLRKLKIVADKLNINSAPFTLSWFFRFLQAELHKALPAEFPKPSGDWQNYKDTRYDSFLEAVIDKRIGQNDDRKSA